MTMTTGKLKQNLNGYVSYTNNINQLQMFLPFIALVDIKNLIHHAIQTIDAKTAKKIFYNLLPLQHIFSDDVLQHMLSFNDPKEYRLTCTIFNQFATKNHHQNLKQKQQQINNDTNKKGTVFIKNNLEYDLMILMDGFDADIKSLFTEYTDKREFINTYNACREYFTTQSHLQEIISENIVQDISIYATGKIDICSNCKQEILLLHSPDYKAFSSCMDLYCDTLFCSKCKASRIDCYNCGNSVCKSCTQVIPSCDICRICEENEGNELYCNDCFWNDGNYIKCDFCDKDICENCRSECESCSALTCIDCAKGKCSGCDGYLCHNDHCYMECSVSNCEVVYCDECICNVSKCSICGECVCEKHIGDECCVNCNDTI